MARLVGQLGLQLLKREFNPRQRDAGLINPLSEIRWIVDSIPPLSWIVA